jgi:hypothetical protein
MEDDLANLKLLAGLAERLAEPLGPGSQPQAEPLFYFDITLHM